MSSYLNLYLVPKSKKTKYLPDGKTEEVSLTQEPLLMFSYSRNNPVYQVYNDSLNIAYAGNEDVYTELTLDKAEAVVKEQEADIENIEGQLETYYKILSNCKENKDIIENILSLEDYLKDLKSTWNQLKSISHLVEECKWSDFDKILINIG